MLLSRFWPFYSVELSGVILYSRKKPSKAVLEDIVYGYTVSAHLKDLGAGRTIVVKRKTIMAAEGAEGIEATVKRGCILGRKDATTIIGASDETVISSELLKTMKEYKGKTVAILKDAVKVEDLSNFIRFADQLGLIFLAFEGKKFYNTQLFER